MTVLANPAKYYPALRKFFLLIKDNPETSLDILEVVLGIIVDLIVIAAISAAISLVVAFIARRADEKNDFMTWFLGSFFVVGIALVAIAVIGVVLLLIA